MGAIPGSQLPGHLRLHQRGVPALETCQEDQDVDFKESAPWSALQVRLVHTCLAMANLRDGGLILVGVSERDGRWTLDGISTEHLSTYDPDEILSVVNSFASPFVELDVVTLEHNSATFLALYVHEFRNIPIVCKKNGPSGSNISVGRVYVRPPGLARTTTIVDASQMQDLLELATEKRARNLLETGARVGLVPATPDSDLFDRELGDL